MEAQLEMQTEAQIKAKAEAERLARQSAAASHQTHREGTVSTCVLCEDVAYEPGWYALLASFASHDGDPTITLPDAPLIQI